MALGHRLVISSLPSPSRSTLYWHTLNPSTPLTLVSRLLSHILLQITHLLGVWLLSGSAHREAPAGAGEFSFYPQAPHHPQRFLMVMAGSATSGLRLQKVPHLC